VDFDPRDYSYAREQDGLDVHEVRWDGEPRDQDDSERDINGGRDPESHDPREPFADGRELPRSPEREFVQDDRENLYDLNRDDKGRTLATVNRALGVLRAAVNCGRFQDPPLLSSSPFHRFGSSIKRRDENKRDRRLHRDEEQLFLAACQTMNTAEHKWMGPALHDRIIGAIETCCRQGEMLLIKNKDVDWAQHQIVIRGANAKDSENRRIPFDPNGRLAPILKRRKDLGPQKYVFGASDGEFVASFKTAWESLLLVANGHETKRTKPGARVDREKLRDSESFS
jgi:integrase